MDLIVPFLTVFLSCLAIFLAAYGICAFVRWFRASRRSASLAALARKLGFQFVGSKCSSASDYLCATVWGRRVTPRMWNELRGATDEGEVAYFDGSRAAGDRTTLLSICACHTPYRFERLVIGEQTTFLGRDVSQFLCKDYMELDSAEFTRTFAVECADKKFAYDILHQRAMEFLLKRPQLRMNLFGNCVFFWYERRLPIEGVESFIADTREFARMLPRYLADR